MRKSRWRHAAVAGLGWDTNRFRRAWETKRLCKLRDNHWLHYKLIFDLAQIKLEIVTHKLLPPVFKVEKDELADVFLGIAPVSGCATLTLINHTEKPSKDLCQKQQTEI